MCDNINSCTVGKSSSSRKPPTAIEGGDTAAQISAAKYQWEEEVNTLKTFNTVEQALKNQIIMVFEPMYLDILNDDIVGFANTSARAMIDHLILSWQPHCVGPGAQL
jgi:hypothetical protein